MHKVDVMELYVILAAQIAASLLPLAGIAVTLKLSKAAAATQLPATASAVSQLHYQHIILWYVCLSVSSMHRHYTFQLSTAMLHDFTVFLLSNILVA